MNRKRWGLSLVFVAAIFALVMLLPDAPFAFVAGAVSEAEIPAVLPLAASLVPPAMQPPVPDGILRLLLLFTFFMHLVLVDILLGSTLLAIVERKNFVEDGQGAYLPKILALTVNFGIAPFLFLQIVYGNFLYSGVVLMAVWWLAVILFVMLAYYGLYICEGTSAFRTPVLALAVLLLLMTAFMLTNASTLMLRPDLWPEWFSRPGGTMLNLYDPTLVPRYLHIVLASLAVGGLTLSWRARRNGRRQNAVVLGAEQRFRRGMDWFFHASLAQVPVGLLFLFSLPVHVRGLFLGGGALPTTALFLACSGLGLALFMSRKGMFGPTVTVVLGVILVMVCVRDMVREAMLLPYFDAASLEALAMPHGQTAALGLFLACAAVVIVALVWLGRVLLKALASNDGEIQEG